MVSLYRLVFATLGFVAVITEIVTLNNRNIFNPSNFFSYFTIESNLLAAMMLAIFAFSYRYNAETAKKLYVFKGAITLYMLMTGVIFAVLLAPIEDAILTAVPWDNIVLHYIIPIVVVVDWLCFQPKVVISFKQSLAWLGFPAAYVTYSLIRGSIVGWYPYPFLNAEKNGYIQTLAVIAVLFVLVFFAAQLLRKVSGLGYFLKQNLESQN
jgi:hypothetical protein